VSKTLLAGIATLIAFVPAAQAKQVVLVQLCGASGCTAITPPIAFKGGGRPVTPPLGNYYALRADNGGGRKTNRRLRSYFVAGPGALTGPELRGPGTGWVRVPQIASRLRPLAATLTPFPTPWPEGVYIDGRRAPDPAAFALLLGPLRHVATRWTGQRLISIDMRWSKPNPWAAEAALLDYMPNERVLIRLDGSFAVPRSIAYRIETILRRPPRRV
jgi:hypothetical protein